MDWSAQMAWEDINFVVESIDSPHITGFLDAIEADDASNGEVEMPGTIGVVVHEVVQSRLDFGRRQVAALRA
jgi:hypothetical protein